MAWYFPLLTRAQARMITALVDSGPQTATQMEAAFGRSWGSVFLRLDEFGLVDYDMNAKRYAASRAGKAYVAERG